MGKYLKKILIAGGLGYLGGRMAKYFSDNGFSVRITTRKSENDFPGNIPVNILIIQLDYGSEGELNKAMKGINTLIHLAGPDAHTVSNNPENITRQHVELTSRLVRSAEVNSVKKFIYFSTIHVYGKNLHGTVIEETKPIPVHPFAKAHLEAESVIKFHTKEIVSTIVRCSNSFGAPYFKNNKCWTLVVNDLCKSAFQNGRLTIKSSGQNYRDFIAMEDVVRAVHHLLKLNNEIGTVDIYNLGSSNSVRIIDIAKDIKIKLKNNYEMFCPIDTNGYPEIENKINNFKYSTKKINKTGFSSNQEENEISLLLKYCNNHYKEKISTKSV